MDKKENNVKAKQNKWMDKKENIKAKQYEKTCWVDVNLTLPEKPINLKKKYSDNVKKNSEPKE